MNHLYTAAPSCIFTTALFIGLLVPDHKLVAQATLTTVSPTANARAAARTSPVTATFSQALTPASAAALKVYSAQRGGLRTRGATPAHVSSNTLSFAPLAQPFMPGEEVSATITSAAASSSGNLARGRVVQFTVAAGPGPGTFIPGPAFAAGVQAWAVSLGDLDGDGDLDVVTADVNTQTLNIRLNNGNGAFTGTQQLAITPYPPTNLVLGDVDADGDLDLVVSTSNGTVRPGTVLVWLNNGANAFSGPRTFTTGIQAGALALGDVDADGDLDLVTANYNVTGTVSIRLNDGTGAFGGGQEVAVATLPFSLALGDVDGDGDLDFVTNSARTNSVSVRFNDGAGSFSGSQQVAVGNYPYSVEMGDVDGDGDLDLLTANPDIASSPFRSTISLRLNNGSGIFGGNQDLSAPDSPGSLKLGDLDGDGDLDLVATAADSTNNYSGIVAVQLNNGAGVFSGTQNVPVPDAPDDIALGDVDGDGDLDFVVAHNGGATINTGSVSLNQLQLPTALRGSQLAQSLVVSPNPARHLIAVAGAAARAVVALYDVAGRQVLSGTADPAGNVTIDLPDTLPAGVYWVRSGVAVSRLLVE